MEGDFTLSTGNIFGRKRKRGDAYSREIDKEANPDDGLCKEPGKKHSKGNYFDGPKSAQHPKGGDERHRSEGIGQQSNATEPRSSTVVSEVLRGVNVADFIESRVLEVSNASEALKEASHLEGKRVLQRLPRHMRRRAASYDTRRIPRSQRMAAAREDAANPIKKSKMPSRKHRRRPSNLLEEYNRRKKQNAWLETHIWHAKRFKMTECWGFKMAEHPCDKGFRAAYRASAQGCIMQDISYQSCIEVKGPDNDIIDVFAHLTCKETGSSITSKDILSGKRSCSIVLYEYDSYPYKAVAHVDIIWKPLLPVFEEKQEMQGKGGSDSNLHRTLWMWCHPACHDNVLDVIKDSFVRSQQGSNKGDIIEKDDRSPISDQNEETECIEKGRTEKEQSESERLGMRSEKFYLNDGILVSSMKLDFVKIRLTGPSSHKVLVDALQLHKFKDSKSLSWWQKYYNNSNKELLAEANNAWRILRNLSNQAELPSRLVLGLTVIDPRMNIPIRKTWPGKEAKDAELTMLESKEKIELLMNWSETLCHSPIWNESIREEVKRTKITESELNKKRSEKLDVGEHLQIGDETSRIPILLVQRPGVLESDTSTMSNYGSGWDFIAPSGWGMAFWVSFVYRGAHVGGQREERNISLEGKSLYFPKEYPDTEAGKQHLEDQKVKNEEIYKRFPASKRPNHQKLGISNPFGADWSTLVEEWNDIFGDLLKESNMMSAQENNQKSVDHSEEFSGNPVVSHEGNCIEKANVCDSSTKKKLYVLRNVRLLRDIQEHFIKCELIRSKKGKSKDNFNLDSVASQKKLQLQQQLSDLLLREHGNALIAVSFLCINKGEATDNAVISIPNEGDLTKLSTDPKYPGPKEPMHKGLKELFQTVADASKIQKSRATSIGSCTRWTIGHVTSGRYSYTNGKGSGVGFVCIKGLLACFDKQKTLGQGCIVLLRNTNSQQYRFARVSVVL